MKNKSCILGIFFYFAFFSSQAYAIAPHVAILPFENANKDASLDWLSMSIAETVTNDLLIIKNIVLVERIQLKKVMEEQKLQLTGAVDEATAVNIGKLIGANVLVVGAFQIQGETVRLTARFVDVETGGILQTAKTTGNMNEIFDLQDKIVKDLAKNLNIELKQEELAKIALKPTDSLEAYQHFGAGSLLQAKNDYQGAVRELEKSIKIDPKFRAAREKFNEAFWSLNKGSYWTYEIKGKEGGFFSKFVNQSTFTRRAGGLENLNGLEVFTYIVEGGKEQKLTGLARVYGLNSLYDMKSQFTLTQYYSKGEDGVYYLGERKETTSEDNKTILINIFDVPVLIFPYEVVEGKEWKSRYTTKRITKISGISDETMIQSEAACKIVGREMVSTPAGVFDCFVIEYKNQYNENETTGSGKTETTYWFASGIGIVKEVYKQDETGAMKSGKVKPETILNEYHIEE